jgi:hypothetical protein
LVLRSKIVVIIILLVVFVLLVFARGGGVIFANSGEKEECFCSSNDVYIQRCRVHARNNERIDVTKIPSNSFSV